MHVTIVVHTEAALTLHGRRPTTTASEELSQAAKEVGVVLEPMHPGAEDPDSVRYFTVEVADSATADRVIARLRRCAATEGTFVKPPDESP